MIESDYLAMPKFLPRSACISMAYAIIWYISVTFLYHLETAKDMATFAMECV